MVSLRQIAEEAGVHVGTVSAILNQSKGNSRFSEDTQERVKRIAKRLGYVTNRNAQRLRRGNSQVIGFIGGDVRNPFFAELTAKLEETLTGRGYHFITSHLSDRREVSLGDQVDGLLGQSVEQIIYWVESEAGLRLPRTGGVKRIPVGFSLEERSGVWLDLEYGVRLAVDYFTKRGCRRLAYYTPRIEGGSDSSAARSVFFRRACESCGSGEPKLWEYGGEPWDVESAIRDAVKLWEEGRFQEVDGVVAFNDVAAVGLLMAMQGRRNRVPVVCFDGMGLVRGWRPRVAYLNLQLDGFVERIVSVVEGERTIRAFRGRDQWIRATLVE